MKPRIKKIGGMWYCGMADRPKLGLGFTPLKAYDNWLAIVTHPRLK